MPDDQQVNCILEVCCGKDGKQLKALTHVLHDEVPLAPDQAQAVAAYLISHFDFAPKGSLYAFKERIAELARGNDYV